MRQSVDVCVAGGGPGGSAVAGTLARLGYRVVVLAHAPRQPPVGESLSPGIWPVLEILGLDRATVQDLGLRVVEAAVRWREDEDELVRLEDGIVVDRVRFDAVLLTRAEAAGATVVPTRAGRPVRTARGWVVPCSGGAVRARYLVDATGRQRLVRGVRTRTSARTVALHARWASNWPEDAPQTRIRAIADGWLWCARLPGDEVRLMAFVDPERMANGLEGTRQLFRRLLVQAPEMGQSVDPLPASVPVQVCDATSYRISRAAEMDLIRVGEAAFGIDPLSSSGVQTAIQTGLAAAATVHSILGSDGDAAAGLEYYDDLIATNVARHHQTAAELYAAHRPYADQPFWQRRAGTAPSREVPEPPSCSLAELSPHAVRLRPPAELRSVPCRLGDRIVRQAVLTSPVLDRPVAFLAGCALTPLIREMEAAPSLAAALDRWDRDLPPGQGRAIAQWLVERGLVELVT